MKKKAGPTGHGGRVVKAINNVQTQFMPEDPGSNPTRDYAIDCSESAMACHYSNIWVRGGSFATPTQPNLYNLLSSHNL